MTPHRAASRRAFTLIEVLVALVVGTVVVEGARRLLEALADSESVIRRMANDIEAEVNAEMVLRSLVRQLHAGATTDTIVADSQALRFTSSCETASGWAERCRVALSLTPGTGVRLLVHAGDGVQFTAPWPDITGPLVYLDQSGETREWKSYPADRIAALGIVRARDTLLLPLGTR